MLIKEVIRIDSLFKEITTDNVNDKKISKLFKFTFSKSENMTQL